MSKHQFAKVRVPIELDNPSIVRDDDKCVKCGLCRNVCQDEIGVNNMYDLNKTDDFAVCTHCGQCANVCPVESITEVSDYEKVETALADPEKIVIFSTSPAVRVALGEEFGLTPGEYVEGKMVAALRALGADYVLDTTFAADLTIMEEAAELVERITKKTKPLPQFTSCCPAWVEFVEYFYPEYIPNLSTAKSPIGMQGATIKTYFAKERGIDPTKIVNVAVAPCTAKKFEIKRPEMKDSADICNPNLRDMDYAITTRELAKWLKQRAIDFNRLENSEYDQLLSRGSGAGVIFGNTGGVMEAAVRTAYHFITGEQPPRDLYQLTAVRGIEGLKEADLTIAGNTVKVAVMTGTGNMFQLMKRILVDKVQYDFIEVMTCRGGCIGGGGQPRTEVPMTDAVRYQRIAGLYQADATDAIRLSYENPDIKAIYENFYDKPLSDKAEKLLHTSYNSKEHLLDKIK